MSAFQAIVLRVVFSECRMMGSIWIISANDLVLGLFVLLDLYYATTIFTPLKAPYNYLAPMLPVMKGASDNETQ